MVPFRFSPLIILVLVYGGLTGCAKITEITQIFDSQSLLKNGAPFGAVAFSESTQNWQITSDHPNQLAARTKALSGCVENDCKIMLIFGRGVCSSLSLDALKVSASPHVSASTDEASAINMARQACSADGGKDCKATPPICN